VLPESEARRRVQALRNPEEQRVNTLLLDLGINAVDFNARISNENRQETHSILHSVRIVDLNRPEIYDQVKKDYELVQDTILKKGFEYLSGAMGKFVQPRTKGPGHGSTSRAFYARKEFLSVLLGI
jgi:hypothetical protein